MPGFGRDQATGRVGCSGEMSRKELFPANRKKLPTDEKNASTAPALSGTPPQPASLMVSWPASEELAEWMANE